MQIHRLKNMGSQNVVRFGTRVADVVPNDARSCQVRVVQRDLRESVLCARSALCSLWLVPPGCAGLTMLWPGPQQG